ncbi:hypothetical protein [Consotaella aegiceratis]|uniref:hypothetical protein n=1 Tax=Consotaella aegiceratis TaxID=3097961 RepID=UPI002F40BEF7
MRSRALHRLIVADKPTVAARIEIRQSLATHASKCWMKSNLVCFAWPKALDTRPGRLRRQVQPIIPEMHFVSRSATWTQFAIERIDSGGVVSMKLRSCYESGPS